MSDDMGATPLHTACPRCGSPIDCRDERAIERAAQCLIALFSQMLKPMPAMPYTCWRDDAKVIISAYLGCDGDKPTGGT